MVPIPAASEPRFVTSCGETGLYAIPSQNIPYPDDLPSSDYVIFMTHGHIPNDSLKHFPNLAHLKRYELIGDITFY